MCNLACDTKPDGVQMEVGVCRGALITGLGELVGCGTRALQVQQLGSSTSCQSCMHSSTITGQDAMALSQCEE